MDIADHRNRRLDVHHIALLHKQLFCLSAHRFDDRVGEELLAVEPFDAFVQIDAGYATWLANKSHGGDANIRIPGRPGIAGVGDWGNGSPGEWQLFQTQDGASGTAQFVQPGLIILRSAKYPVGDATMIPGFFSTFPTYHRVGDVRCEWLTVAVKSRERVTTSGSQAARDPTPPSLVARLWSFRQYAHHTRGIRSNVPLTRATDASNSPFVLP